MKTARRLVLEGLAHRAASDIHRPEDQTSVAAGMAWIKKQRGHGVLDQMLDENPRRLLAGELPDAPRSREPASLRSSVAVARRGRGLRRLRRARHGRARRAPGAARAARRRRSALYLATLAVTHLFRAWRWEYLLRPLGVSLPLRRLLLISSVGFMAILALPVRLGEFVRPYFVTRERGVRMSAAVGTVAVERIIDGLLISILFFVSYLASAGDPFTPELRVGAWVSLLGFVGLTTFLALARVWTEQTIAFALRVSLLQCFAPARAPPLADKLRALISGFHVLADRRNFGIFLAQSVLYWTSTGSACGSSRARWACRSRSAPRTRRWPSRASCCRCRTPRARRSVPRRHQAGPPRLPAGRRRQLARDGLRHRAARHPDDLVRRRRPALAARALRGGGRVSLSDAVRESTHAAEVEVHRGGSPGLGPRPSRLYLRVERRRASPVGAHAGRFGTLSGFR